MVMDALKNPQFKRRFKILVEALGRGENVDLKARAPPRAVASV